jgi:regulator of cell morphogenesis and NO signaling
MRRSIHVPAIAGDPTSIWELRPQAELVQHIEHHYHAGLRRDLPMLVELARHVERDRASHQVVPAGLTDLVADFAAELDGHMREEETVLFPTLRGSTRHGELDLPIRRMERDHEAHADRLERIREATGYLQAPADAAPICKALYAGLAELEMALREHIYLEDGVLFERAISGR